MFTRHSFSTSTVKGVTCIQVYSGPPCLLRMCQMAAMFAYESHPEYDRCSGLQKIFCLIKTDKSSRKIKKKDQLKGITQCCGRQSQHWQCQHRIWCNASDSVFCQYACHSRGRSKSLAPCSYSTYPEAFSSSHCDHWGSEQVDGRPYTPSEPCNSAFQIDKEIEKNNS